MQQVYPQNNQQVAGSIEGYFVARHLQKRWLGVPPQGRKNEEHIRPHKLAKLHVESAGMQLEIDGAEKSERTPPRRATPRGEGRPHRESTGRCGNRCAAFNRWL